MLKCPSFTLKKNGPKISEGNVISVDRYTGYDYAITAEALTLDMDIGGCTEQYQGYDPKVGEEVVLFLSTNCFQGMVELEVVGAIQWVCSQTNTRSRIDFYLSYFLFQQFALHNR